MPLHLLSTTLDGRLHAPDWSKEHGWRFRVWQGLSRLGLTGVHSAPIHADWLDVVRLDLPLRGLDPAFDGFALAQVSDLHLSPVVWKGFLREQMRHVADLRPDLIVVTGDLITGGYRYARLAADLLKHVRPMPPHGIVSTLGNHDYSMHGKRSPREAERRSRYFTQVFADRGLPLLKNQVLRVTRAGATRPLTLVGLDDLWTGRLDADAAFAGVGDGEATICLNHDPKNAKELLAYPWQWMLSGHTHGRQLATSRVGRRFNHKRRREFVGGLYPLPGGRHLYVNRGLSYGQRYADWCKPEITLFTLRAA